MIIDTSPLVAILRAEPEAEICARAAMRLQPSLLEEARKLAEEEGVALNQLINLAVAEKVSALRTENYIAERASRANVPEALKNTKAGWHRASTSER